MKRIVAIDDSVSMVDHLDHDQLVETIGEGRFLGFLLDDRLLRPLGDFETADQLLERVEFSSTRSRLWDALTLLIVHLAKRSDGPFHLIVVSDGVVMDTVYSNGHIVAKLIERKQEDGWKFSFSQPSASWVSVLRYDRFD